MSNRFLPIAGCFFAVCLASGIRADEKDSEKSSTDRKTHTVERHPFKVEVEFDGIFESEQIYPVSLRPEVWSTLKVERVVDEGEFVNEGEPLLWLDTRKIDEEIRSVKFSRDLGYLSLKQAEAELQLLEQSSPLDLEAAQRARRIAEEDLTYYREVDEDQKKRSAEESLKAAEYNLEYAQEELDQLQQMYKADDLTEETEEIILKRAQRDVERGKFFLESAKLRHERTLSVLLPRELQQLEESAIRSKLNLAKVEMSVPTALETKRIELQKLQSAQDQIEEKLAFLKADREQMVAKAPASGVVYYGESNRGKWSTASTIRQQLRPGGTVSANTVLMTIVPGEPTFVRIDIPEDKYRYVKSDTPATIKPSAFPKVTLAGRCRAPGPVLVKDGTFDGRVEFDSKTLPEAAPIKVGMTSKVVLTPVLKEDAITVPSSAVFEDEIESARHFVYVDGDDDEPARRTVEIGEKSDGQTEILSGLEPSEVILLEKP